MGKILIDKLGDTKEALISHFGSFPKIAIVLGSGLGELANDLEEAVELPYREIPYFQSSSVIGHRGCLRVGKLEGVPIACMVGRLHGYEGLDLEDVVYPVRALAFAGVDAFLLTNAAGGLNPNMQPLDFMLIKDHINMSGMNPLIGPNHDGLGPRFPDLTNLYDEKIGAVFAHQAKMQGITMHEGVYVQTSGPSYETPAEVRAYGKLGGHAVGMSTVPEAISLRHMGKRVAGISCITNLAAGVSPEPLIHDDVLENAKNIYKCFSQLIRASIKDVEKLI